MLKKLLASALAVATVASCAYVPSALASAATVEYHTADVVKYMDWKLNTPDAPSTNVDVNIYVNTNVIVGGQNVGGVYTLNIAPEKNTEADVKAALNDAKKGGTKWKDVEGAGVSEIKETEAAVKYVVEYFYPAGTNTYVAQITKKRAVVYSTWKDGLVSNIEDVKAKTLSDNDVKLLGYYNDDATGMPSALAEITQAKYISEVKLANYAFKNWVFTNGTDAKVSTVSPYFGAAVTDPTNVYYKKVSIVKAAESGNLHGINPGILVAGTYYALNKYQAMGATFTDILVPKSDEANWVTYLNNYLKLNFTGDTLQFRAKVLANGNPDLTSDELKYTATKTVRKVDDGKYAVLYKQADAANAEEVDYELTLRDVTDASNVVATVSVDNVGYVNADAINWTTDPTELYALIKTKGGSVDAGALALKGDLAAFMNQNKDAHGTIYELTDKYATVSVIKTGNKEVVVDVYVTPKDEYTVYSYAANDTMKETKVYLSMAEADNKGQYKNQDGTTQIVDKKVTVADAAKLGVATSATIKGVPAEYAYAQTDIYNKLINCTYKTGASIGVALDDFQTATGEFQTEPYFGRDAKVGDQVTLKVSLSDAGVAKKLDLTKVTVEFAAAGVATVSENFDYAATEFPAGVATTLTLAQGTNIVTATVYYDGAKVGTFAPFYAYVG